MSPQKFWDLIAADLIDFHFIVKPKAPTKLTKKHLSEHKHFSNCTTVQGRSFKGFWIIELQQQKIMFRKHLLSYTLFLECDLIFLNDFAIYKDKYEIVLYQWKKLKKIPQSICRVCFKWQKSLEAKTCVEFFPPLKRRN